MLYRQIFDTIWSHIDSPEILLLNGARQVGKTTLLQAVSKKLQKEGSIPLSRIHLFDLERTDHAALWSNQTSALAALPLNDPQKHYVFIDEFQTSPSIGTIVKVLHDHSPQFKIILTGSASWYVNIDESLAGRKRVIPIWPLSFEEFLRWKTDPSVHTLFTTATRDVSSLSSKATNVLNTHFIEFMTYGGYPSVVKTETREEKVARLGELIDAYILRDIQLWNRAANAQQVRRLLTLLASIASSILNVQTLSLNSGIRRTALENRLDLLERTFVLSSLRPYFTNKTKELVKNPKVVLVDSGLRNRLLDQMTLHPQTSDFGHVAENTITTELLKRAGDLDRVMYWRTKNGQEIDLVVKHEQTLLPIGIKTGDVHAIPSGLRTFIRTYRPSHAVVLNWSRVNDVTFEGCAVHIRPLWFDLLAQKWHLPLSA